VERLGAAATLDVKDFASYLDALRRRHDFFHRMGCRLSDHGLETAYAEDYEKTRSNGYSSGPGRPPADARDVLKFKSAMLVEFGVMDAEKDWTQQFHFGALRNVNSRMFRQLGPDKGYDTIGDAEVARPLARLLDRLDSQGPSREDHSLQPQSAGQRRDGRHAGNFQDGSVPARMAVRQRVWFLDHWTAWRGRSRISPQMGLLSRFVACSPTAVPSSRIRGTSISGGSSATSWAGTWRGA